MAAAQVDDNLISEEVWPEAVQAEDGNSVRRTKSCGGHPLGTQPIAEDEDLLDLGRAIAEYMHV